jgi:CubicO group peptidase (beta-lactamase class C family)
MLMKYAIVKKLSFVFIISFIFIASFVPYAEAHFGNNAASFIDDQLFDMKMQTLRRLADMSSISACIVKNDSVVWSEGYGLSNRLLLKKPTDDTVYYMGSVSKAITAMAIMQLYEKGFFGLDDNVSEYLPFDLKNPDYPNVNITFRMLLAHQSSLHDHSITESYVYLFSDRRYSYVRELLLPDGEAYNPEYWASYPPGEEANYSNIGFVVIAYLIEQISDQSFELYCQENIFTPLQMKKSSFDIDGYKRGDLAAPYIRYRGIYLRLPNYDFKLADPCGGLCSTTEDLSHFLIAHMNGGVYNGVRILNESTVELMHTVQYPNSSVYIIYRFGLGWLFTEENGEIYQGHDGDIFGFHARMRFRESDKTGVIYFYNSDSFGPLIRIRPFLFAKLIKGPSQYKLRTLLFTKAGEF